MNLQKFAEDKKLQLKKDSCGDAIVPGKKMKAAIRREDCCHIYDGFGRGLLGACFLFFTKKKWNRVRGLLQEAGCHIVQNGDTEGCVTFDPRDENKQDS
jgi:hypothetical protein